jgi:cytochrome c-type biogenesis protein
MTVSHPGPATAAPAAAAGTIAISNRRETFFHALAFVAGFTAVFVVLGASVAFVGYALDPILPVLIKIGGLALIIFGLQISGMLGWGSKAIRRNHYDGTAWGSAYLWAADGLARLLYTEGRVQMQTDRSWGYLSSALMGVFFSAGWIPCVGPVLSAIYLLASDTGTVGHGALLLLAYAAGLGIPFLITGAAFSSVSAWLKRMNRHLGMVSKITGIFLILLGVLLFSRQMTVIAIFFVQHFGYGLASYAPEGASTPEALTLPIALIAGLLSFLSPCVLPIIPAYIGYLSGTTVVGASGVGEAAPPAQP